MSTKTTGDWRSNYTVLTERLCKARQDKLFTDIKFVIGKGESSKEFDAHKSILACGSPVFEGMFFGESAVEEDCINIEEDDPEAFGMLLDYLYGKGDDVKISSFDSAWNYYIIGEKYLVSGIQENVEKYIRNTCMNEKSFWTVIQNNTFSSPVLKRKIDSFIEVNAESLLSSVESLNAPEVIVENILQMDKLNISEFDLLQFLTKWGYHNLGIDAMTKERLPLFQHIRFGVLSGKDFCAFTEKYPNVIDPESCFKILKHLLDKATYKLPEWCTTKNGIRKLAFQEKSSNSKANGCSSPFGKTHMPPIYASFPTAGKPPSGIFGFGTIPQPPPAHSDGLFSNTQLSGGVVFGTFSK